MEEFFASVFEKATPDILFRISLFQFFSGMPFFSAISKGGKTCHWEILNTQCILVHLFVDGLQMMGPKASWPFFNQTFVHLKST